MKRFNFCNHILFLTFILTVFNGIFAMEKDKQTALLIIDIQNFYYPDGKWELEDPEPAGLNAHKILQKFRALGMTIIHVRHDSEPGGEIHDVVKPLEGEKVIVKKNINSFLGTDLLDYLKKKEIEKLVICGMQTHMCVEAATRAAHDYGFHCTVVGDACATKTLEFDGNKIPAQNVHYSTLSTLSGNYARIIDTKSLLE